MCRIASLVLNKEGACVHDGASIGFVLPFTSACSETFWRNRVLPAVQIKDRLDATTVMYKNMS